MGEDKQEEKSLNLVLLEGIVSVFCNTLLFALKLWVGIITGSVALTADAWHTLTDSASSGVVIISSLASNKPADDDHPFGHGRTDLICSVIIGVFLVMIGIEFVIKSIEQLQGGEQVVFGRIAVVVTLLSIAVKELMAQFAFWAGRKTANPILKADGWHHRTDALSSVVVLAGILCSGFFWWIDGVLGILVAALIFYASFEILRDSINRLIGEQPDQELLDQISALIEELGFDVHPHHFHLHRYGDHIELTFHIDMAHNLTLHEAHEQTHKIEQLLRRRMQIEATIHMEPRKENN